jgi:hypothetical protein
VTVGMAMVNIRPKVNVEKPNRGTILTPIIKTRVVAMMLAIPPVAGMPVATMMPRPRVNATAKATAAKMPDITKCFSCHFFMCFIPRENYRRQ